MDDLGSYQSFVAKDTLFIMSTLTDQFLNQSQVNNWHILDLMRQGSHTCPDRHNRFPILRGRPSSVTVRSARLTTNRSKSIGYCKMEVVATLPVADWLWPAIWIMLVIRRLGEIDAMGFDGKMLTIPQEELIPFKHDALG